ncbi:hypothetical protein BOX15_Mlig026307g1 [Macrostomum lignano]|uniref:Uncharacterized protein n=3 Tax=Macrostomum lignano TaxID=282301 RepID=A0A267ELX0_9PLAT|nr:hypothetical protein BOX15_Mlig031234g1 [Macrostomum lignano]PAA72712.1 hypothetical protein BOX15_Mlig026307g1 [Macrostomum lignano]
MDARVLSIQSHVVHGFAGNRSAIFPLQVLGFDVDFINTVQFSNHTAYPVFKGDRLSTDQLKELYSALAENSIDNYSYVLTGFCFSADLLKEILEIVRHQKKKNPKLLYFCDPVLGDNGKFYVPEELVPAFKEALEVADFLTPNQFELQQLSGLPVTDEPSALAAIDTLMRSHANLKFVCLTSTDFGDANGILHGLAVARGSGEGSVQRLRYQMPRLAESFVGTGDLFTALLLAWNHKLPDNPKLVLERVISTVYTVLLATVDYIKVRRNCGSCGSGGPQPSGCQQQQSPWAVRELRLVQSRSAIERPPPPPTSWVQLI